MNERFPPLKPGDRLTADQVNRMADAIERSDMFGAGTLNDGTITSAFAVRTVPGPTRILFVRLTADADFVDPGTAEPTDDNAFILEYYTDNNEWMDGTREIRVTNPFDGTTLTADQQIFVYFNRQADKWLPFGSSTVTASPARWVRLTSTTPNGDGLFTGILQVENAAGDNIEDGASPTDVMVRDVRGAAYIPLTKHMATKLTGMSDDDPPLAIYAIAWGQMVCVDGIDENCDPEYVRLPFGSAVSSTPFSPC